MKRLTALVMAALWFGVAFGVPDAHAGWSTTKYEYPP